MRVETSRNDDPPLVQSVFSATLQMLTQILKPRKAIAAKSGARLIPAEELYALDLAELDRVNPSWDYRSVCANAAVQLNRGMLKEDVEQVFGAQISREAERLLGDAEWRRENLPACITP